MTNYGTARTGLKKNHVTLWWHNYCMMPGHTPHPLTHTPRTSLSLSLSVTEASISSLTHLCAHVWRACVSTCLSLCMCLVCVCQLCVCDPRRHSSPHITATTCNKHLCWMNDKTKQSACLLQPVALHRTGWDRWRIGTTSKHSMMVSIKSQAICRSWQCSPSSSYVRFNVPPNTL